MGENPFGAAGMDWLKVKNQCTLPGQGQCKLLGTLEELDYSNPGQAGI
jgi:hypothetical protein